jgi:hypothetical protein
MALSEYVPVKESVSFSGGSAEVRGLAADDLSVLLANHLPDLDNLMRMYESKVSDDVKVAAVMQYCIQIVRDAPGLAAHVIALASDEVDQVDMARKLPLAVQTKLLQKIVQLTFAEAGGPKNFLDSLKGILQRG